jgi:hypothetical protein
MSMTLIKGTLKKERTIISGLYARDEFATLYYV